MRLVDRFQVVARTDLQVHMTLVLPHVDCARSRRSAIANAEQISVIDLLAQLWSNKCQLAFLDRRG